MNTETHVRDDESGVDAEILAAVGPQDGVTYYHGGPRNLRKILPVSVTGAKGQAHYGNHLAKPHKVYLTTDPKCAALFACGYPKGSIYIVRPVGELVEDPDCVQKGLSFECEKADVVKEIRLKPSMARFIRQAVMSDEK